MQTVLYYNLNIIIEIINSITIYNLCENQIILNIQNKYSIIYVINFYY